MWINKHQACRKLIKEKSIVCAIFASWKSVSFLWLKVRMGVQSQLLGAFRQSSENIRMFSELCRKAPRRSNWIGVPIPTFYDRRATNVSFNFRFNVIGISPFTTLVCGKNRFLIKSYIVIILLWIWNLIKSLCFNIFLTTCITNIHLTF